MKKPSILVSACLLGVCCRYDGDSKPCESVVALRERFVLVPICPEVDGGLPTPRTPSERVGDRVLMRDGKDVSENYMKGAVEALRKAELFGCTAAILKARSPSCGKGKIYDGSFSGKLTERHGVAAELLMKNGIEVYTEDETDLLIKKYLDKA